MCGRAVGEGFLEKVAVLGPWRVKKTIGRAEEGISAALRSTGKASEKGGLWGEGLWAGVHEGLMTPRPRPQAHSMAAWSGPGAP